MTKGWYGNRYGHSLASKGIRSKLDLNSSYKTYGEWIKAVDNEFWSYIGLGVHDMRDYMWRDLYDDTLTPREAFRSFIEDNLDDLGDAGWEIMRKMDEEDEVDSGSLSKLEKIDPFEVIVIDENGKEYSEYFDNEKDAYERWLEYRSRGNETWYSKHDKASDYYETVQVYDPEEDEHRQSSGVKESPTAKNINITMSKIEKDAEETAVVVNEGIAKLKRLAKRVKKEAGEKFNKSAEDTAKTLKNLGKKIDDSAEDTAKDINKILKVKK